MSTEPLVGYRAWAMRQGSNGLFGVYFNAKPWEAGGVTIAECRAREGAAMPIPPEDIHPAPQADCRCGLHARTTLDGLLDEYPNYPMSNKGRFNGGKYFEKYKTLILGAVLLWGDVVRGDLVIRAQCARPICFTTLPDRQHSVPDWDELANNVSSVYSVPIVPWNGMQMFSAEFGEVLTKH